MSEIIVRDVISARQWLSSVTTGGTYQIPAHLFGTPLLRSGMGLIPGVSSLQLRDVSINTETLSISGSSTILSSPGTHINIQFKEGLKGLYPEIEALLPVTQAWDFFELLPFKIAGIRINLIYKENAGTFQSRISCKLQSKSSSLDVPVEILMPSDQSDWVLRMAPGTVIPVNPAQIAPLVTLDQISEIIDPELFSTDQLSLRNIRFEFNPFERYCSYIQAGLQYEAPGGWSFLDGLIVVKNLYLDFGVHNPLGRGKRDFILKAGGTTELAGALFIAEMQFPGNVIAAATAPGTSLKLIPFLEHWGLPLPEGMPDIVIDRVELKSSLSRPQISFLIDVNKSFSLTDSIVADNLHFSAAAEKNPETRKWEFSGDFYFQLSAGKFRFMLQANYSGNQGLLFEARASDIPLSELAEAIADKFGALDIPDALSGLHISTAHIVYNSNTKNFAFDCEITFPLDGKTAQLSLEIHLKRKNNGYDKFLSGTLRLGSRSFTVSFRNENGLSTLLAEYANPSGERIHLVNDVLDLVFDNPDIQLNDEYNLLEFTLYKLQLSLEKNRSSGAKGYGIVGDFGWEPNLTIGDSDPLKLRAAIDLHKPPGGKLSGSVAGMIQTPIPEVEFLKLGGFYRFSDQSSALGLAIQIGTVILEASYDKANPEMRFRLGGTQPVTFKNVMNFFAGLVNPAWDDFDFDPPWDTFTSLDLRGIELTFNRSTREIGMDYTFSPGPVTIPGLPAALLSIRSIGLRYNPKGRGGKSKAIRITVDGTFLGKSQRLSWDPINDAPPQVPGKGASVFDLRYLGLGQHVAFTRAAQVNSIREVMQMLRDAINERKAAVAEDGGLALRNPMETFAGGDVIAFSPESEWLIGLDVSLLRTVSLSVIFNDPFIYGLRIELSGSLARNFAGLQFEILYQRITDKVGKYHIELTLPDYVRRFQLGAVTITLPVMVLDIFTNGDFKIDLGFPWNFNFARSFALELFPFTGAGGFYFNKLSAVTASSTPRVAPEKGSFTPVYEFGIGLKAGLGKSFSAGPLKAEISITIQGLIEGIISWYNPVQRGSREMYFKIKGGIALVGRIYGEVDFGIVSASVELVVTAMIQFVLESYRPTQLLLTARVSARASIKIAFIRIRFSFSMTVRQEFTLPSPNGNATAPWLQ